MDNEVIEEVVSKLASKYNLNELFDRLLNYMRGVEKKCDLPANVRDFSYKDEGRFYAIQQVVDIALNGRKEGYGKASMSTLLYYVSHLSGASMYSEDYDSDAEIAKGENYIKFKVSNWIKYVINN